MARKLGPLHENILQHGNWREGVQAYLASISFADAQVGRLLDALEAGPQRDHTIIVLWGDHGWHLGEKRHWSKFTLWEESTHTPLIFVVPGLTAPASECAHPVDLIHVYPTLADLCGLPLPAGQLFDGASLRPLLAHPQAAWDRPAIMTHGRNNHAVRTDRWRYIRYADGSEELYDHAADPNEWHNLAREPASRTIRQELAARLPQFNAPEAPRLPKPENPGVGPGLEPRPE
ncbi:MAG: sulfatase-like hydrolase/transferase [Opitutae bacterium]|nr:sulfatase-like hydrolase/transferase [Opitutae bacterium]